MLEKSSFSEKIGSSINYFFLVLLFALCLYPMWHVVCGSVSDPVWIMQHNGLLFWPNGFSLEGYKQVFGNPNIGAGYLNTIFYTVVGTSISMLLTTLGAYALSRTGYMFKKGITFFIVFTMYFSGGIIPSFLLVDNLALTDTRWAILLPTAIATWNMIVMKTAFQSVPKSLEEAAKIDGANDIYILFKIFIPVSIPTMAVITLFYVVAQWNSWFNASIYIDDRSLLPLQVFLREILLASSLNSTSGMDSETYFLEKVIRYSTIVVSTVPILCVYPFAQRYFMSGLMLGSVKE